MKHLTNQKIGIILNEMGFLPFEVIEKIINLQEKQYMPFGQIAVEYGYIPEEALSKALAVQFNLEYIDLKNEEVDTECFNIVPLNIIEKISIVPFGRDNGFIKIAVSDPTNIEALDEISSFTGDATKLFVTSPANLARIIKKREGSFELFKEVSEDFKFQISTGENGDEEVLSLQKISEDSAPIIKLVNSIILDAINKRASDIHIQTSFNGVVVKYRVDGVLYQPSEPLPVQYQSSIISRIKVMSELDISERRIPQDGRFKVKIGQRGIDFRVSIMPSNFGEDAVLRILDKDSLTSEFNELSLEILGFEPEILKKLRKLICEPYGMILVTGPTGSGKTTTLYACISEIKTGKEKIITIEDPIEYQLDGILQVPVNEKKGLTFARGLRSILRHDPDKIMVGEIRDSETAQIAVQAALTGHLVFTTVHANNVFDVIGRFTHMDIEPYNFVSSLNCVLAQRLIRKICIYCKKIQKVSPEYLDISGIKDEAALNTGFYHGEGCKYCDYTGYSHRTAISELLVLNDEIRELIVSKAPVSKLKEIAVKYGTVFLRESAIEKVEMGITSLEEINRVTFV